MKFTTAYFRSDILSGIVVFLVALPLCLGIALASGAPLFSGIIAGVVGGIVVGVLSGSELSVSGPAAGLSAIVLASISKLGSFEVFLAAVVLAGILQLLFFAAKAGSLSNYFPSNVIDGMLTGIGIIIILKQIPHAIGYDKDNEGDFFFIEKGTGHNSFSAIVDAINYTHIGALLISLCCLGILIAFQKVPFLKRLKVVPGALVAVVFGIIANELFKSSGSSLSISQEHLVNLPVASSLSDFFGQFTHPDWSSIMRRDVLITAVTLALVASIETLLCIEATDKMDELKRYSDGNRELFAQGIGNILSGLIGGMPMTSVIVRSTANVTSGGKTRIATITHGILLLFSVMLIPSLLNKIPLASLAAILLMIGYKLASPSVFKRLWSAGLPQFIPFVVTVLAVVFIDLLTGVAIGLAVSIFYILRTNLKVAYFFESEGHQSGETITMQLAQEVSFLNKAAIKQTLSKLPEGTSLNIDASKTLYIDHDVVEMIRDFLISAKEKNIKVNLIGFKPSYNLSASQVHIVTEPQSKGQSRNP